MSKKTATGKCTAATERQNRREATISAMYQLFQGMTIGEALSIVASVKYRLKSNNVIG